jgi:hypothetical protein
VNCFKLDTWEGGKRLQLCRQHPGRSGIVDVLGVWKIGYSATRKGPEVLMGGVDSDRKIKQDAEEAGSVRRP